MANTSITLTIEQGVLVPSQPSVPVKSGDTVTFSAGGNPAFLFFSPGAAAALSPTPSNPVDISAGPAEFAFTTSDPGAYSVYFEATADAAVPDFPVIPSDLLTLQIDANPVFGIIVDNTKG